MEYGVYNGKEFKGKRVNGLQRKCVRIQRELPRGADFVTKSYIRL
jgi:hypothetical protein